jgi:hypothetical protein
MDAHNGGKKTQKSPAGSVYQWSQIPITLKRIGILEVKSWISIHIKVLRIRNPGLLTLKYYF